MSHQWDELSKSLAEESLPRRESLRRIGAVLAGAVLSPLGLGTAWARGPDPCKTFCNQCPKSRRSNCLAACNACNQDTRRLCGGCGNYGCCESGRVCCNGYYCVDLANNVANCGACGNHCYPGPWEYSACIDGRCEYACADGAVYCNGFCTFLASDPDNCGACGNVCDASTRFCDRGTCIECPGGLTQCGNSCVNLNSDPYNCGACGVFCDPHYICWGGVCEYNGDEPNDPWWDGGV